MKGESMDYKVTEAEDAQINQRFMAIDVCQIALRSTVETIAALKGVPVGFVFDREKKAFVEQPKENE